MRAIILFVIGLVFGATAGFLAGGGMGPSSHDHASHDDPAHDHSDLVAWTGPPAELDLILSVDAGTAQNLHILVRGFEFAPEQVNGPNQQGKGHAHVYVNGHKIMRAYGPWVHLPDLMSGDLVRVTLSTNDHKGWAIDGKPFAAEVTVP